MGGGNGKDFVSAFIVLWFFLSRHPCRIVTTSADHYQLEGVLWGEIRNFIQTSRVSLQDNLVVNHLHLRKRLPPGAGTGDQPEYDPLTGQAVEGGVCGLSYCLGRVAAKGEGMLGHHVADTGDGIPRTLFVADEASGVDDVTFNAAETWARRRLIIGNPYECQNRFRRADKEGDLLAP